MSDLSPKFIYFDLDDTLLNHKKAEQLGLADVYHHLGAFSSIALEELIDVYRNINKRLWEEYGRGEIDWYILHRRRFEESFVELGIKPSLYLEAGKVYMHYYRNHWEWIDGAEDAFNTISAQYPTGIITNGFAEIQWKKIKKFGFKDTTRHIVISEEIGVMKPNQKIFDYSTELTEVERHEILYVGDSLPSDVMGGKEAGWKIAWYTNNPVDEGYLLADLVFDDFKKLLFKLGLC